MIGIKVLARVAIPFLYGMISAETVGVFSDTTIGQIKFATSEVKAALELKGYTVEMASLAQLNASYANKKVVIALLSQSAVTQVLTMQAGTVPSGLGAQAYALKTTSTPQTSYWAFGGDTNGTLYGGLQLAENIKFDGFSGVSDEKVSPNLLERGIKLNLPFDMRLPTYSGYMNPTSAKKAIPNVWDMSFWTTWLDEQARNRYNVLSVWVDHPFPAMVKVPEYPLAALPNILCDSGKTINMNIDQRIAFWKAVMSYAHSRGFSFYIFTWNVYVDYASTQYPSLSESVNNTSTIDYMSKSMKALLNTYPDLDGFGIGAGDNMSGETWWTWKAYGQAAFDYAKANPNRKFTIIHRGLKTDFATLDKDWSPLDGTGNFQYNFEVKYCNAHCYSTLSPRAYQNDVDAASKANKKTWLMLRNDDYFYVDIGDPNFIRNFMDSIPNRNTVNSFLLGSDIYQPSRSYFYKDKSLNGQLEIQRNWYIQMLWGRIAYNRQISDNIFKKEMAFRFPQVSSDNLFAAWALASRPLPKFQELTGGSWQLDAHWYAEASAYPNNGGTAFRTIDDEGSSSVAKNSPNQCDIPTSAANGCGTKKTAYKLADEMEADATSSLSLSKSMTPSGNLYLGIAIANTQHLAYLANYLANKIRAGTFKKAGGSVNLANAKDAAAKAYCWWMAYANSMGSMYIGNKFRTVDMGPDWTFGDKWNLDEYTALGGTGTPNCTALIAVGLQAGANFEKRIRIQSLSPEGLNFILPYAGSTNISIFNVFGKLLFEENSFPGKAGINQLWLAKKLDVGLYFVQIKSGKLTTTNKIMITGLK